MTDEEIVDRELKQYDAGYEHGVIHERSRISEHLNAAIKLLEKRRPTTAGLGAIINILKSIQ